MRPAPRLVLASLLFVVAALLLLGTTSDYGLTDDEPTYIDSAGRVEGWFSGLKTLGLRQSLSEARLREGWVFARSENRNLPFPVLLSVAGRVLSSPWASPLVSYRVGPALLVALSTALLFAALSTHGYAVALAGASSFFFMPQVFSHSHLAATDMPASCLWVLALAAWLRSEKSTPWALACGVCCGLGFATKATFLMLPGLLFLWVVAFRRWPYFRALGVVCLSAPLVMLALCPMWWSSPLREGFSYVRKSFAHATDIWGFDSFYLGTRYLGSLPWHNGIVLPLVTTPPWTLALAACSLPLLFRKEAEAGLWALGSVALPILRMLPGSPGHDGVRLLLPSLVCLAPMAGLGLFAMPQRVRGALCAAVLGLGAGEIAWMHPFQMSYYSELIGGLPGAERLGFEVSYWFEGLNPRVLQDIQAHLPTGSGVWTVPSYPGFRLLRQWGLWREDLSSGEEGATYLLLYNRRATVEGDPKILRVRRSREPVWDLRCHGVTVAALYSLAPP